MTTIDHFYFNLLVANPFLTTDYATTNHTTKLKYKGCDDTKKAQIQVPDYNSQLVQSK